MRPTSLTVFVSVVAAAALAMSAAAANSESSRTRPALGQELRIVSAIEVDGAPSSLVAGAGAVWVSLGVDGIARIDPATNEVVALIRPGGIALASGFGAIWAIDVFEDVLLRIDPKTNRVTRKIAVGGLPTAVATGHGSIWVANQLDSTVSRIAPATGRTIATIKLEAGGIWPGGLAITENAVWVVTGDGNAVSRIRPATATVDLRVPIRGARSLAVVLGSVWVGVANSSSLLRITRGKASPVDLPGLRANGYGPQLAGGHALWVAVPGNVARVRPTNGPAPRLRLPADHYLSAIAIAGDVWVADQTAARVIRVAAGDGR